MFVSIRQKLSQFAILAAVVLFLSHSVEAASYYVRISGSDNNTGQNKNSAFRTIQKALDACNSYDRVFIGAGVYNESVRKNLATGNGVQIIGDTTGRYTGDSGQVIWIPRTSSWAVQFNSGSRISLESITFRDPGTRTSYGVHVNDVVGTVYASDCQFENLRTGMQARKCQTAYAINSLFSGTQTGFYFENTQNAYAIYAKFNECYIGVNFNNASIAYSYGCSYTNSTSGPYSTTSSRAVLATGGQLYVFDNQIDNISYGVHASKLESAFLTRISIKTPQSYGIYVSGSNLQASDISVQGAGDRKGYGVRMDDIDGRSPILRNVTTNGLYGGILGYGNSYEFQNVSSTGSYMGVYFTGTASEVAINGKGRVTLRDNHIGVYANSRAIEQLNVSNLDIQECYYAVYSAYTSLKVERSLFKGCNVGVYAIETPSSIVDHCVFDGRLADSTLGTYGGYLRGEDNQVSNCEFANFRSGLTLYNRNESSPKLSNVTITDCQSHGLLNYYGELVINKRTNLVIKRVATAIYSVDSKLTLSNIIPPEDVTDHIRVASGQLNANGFDLQGGRTGIYLTSLSNAQISDVKLSNFSSNGLYASAMGDVQLSNVVASDNGSHGVWINSTESFTAKASEFANNKSHGLFVRGSTDGSSQVRLLDCRFEGNSYGYRSFYLPFSDAVASGNDVVGNSQGLRVEYGAVSLTAKSKNRIEKNSYGLMNYYGNTELDGLELPGNTYAVYAYESPVALTNCSIEQKIYGLLAYSGSAAVKGCDFSGAGTAVYFAPRSTEEAKFSVQDTSIKGATTGIYTRNYSDVTPVVTIDNVTISSTSYSLYAITSAVDVKNCSFESTGSATVYQTGGNVSLADCNLVALKHWGVLTYGEKTKIVRTRINSRYGVYLRSGEAQLINDVIQGSHYGVYCNLDEGNYEILQTTIANIAGYGIYHNAGNLVVRNSIVNADSYAIYNRAVNGTFEHDHNLIAASRQNFVGALPGLNEIEKQPIFVDPASGDLHLAAGSPAINAGVELGDEASIDIEGNKRPSFRQFEMGAYEFTESAGSLRVLNWDETAK